MDKTKSRYEFNIQRRRGERVVGSIRFSVCADVESLYGGLISIEKHPYLLESNVGEILYPALVLDEIRIDSSYRKKGYGTNALRRLDEIFNQLGTVAFLKVASQGEKIVEGNKWRVKWYENEGWTKILKPEYPNYWYEWM